MQTPGHCVIYRFRVREGFEQQFIDSWSRITVGLRDGRGALGSRLHRGPDDIWYAYAQWPSAEVRSKAFAGGAVDAEASELMREAIEEDLPEIVLSPEADFLILPR
ncbi:MAG: antibiotic biosynthesis monooxygenase [Phycisphaerales bacterium JB061]